MSTRQPMTPEQIREALAGVPEWREDGDGMVRTFVFRDFVQAFGFMASAALVAERLNHHPDWSNSWKKVEVRLSTHDAGGLTGLDFELARSMDALASA